MTPPEATRESRRIQACRLIARAAVLLDEIDPVLASYVRFKAGAVCPALNDAERDALLFDPAYAVAVLAAPAVPPDELAAARRIIATEHDAERCGNCRLGWACGERAQEIATSAGLLARYVLSQAGEG